MKRNSKYIILICSFILISSLWALNADFLESSRFLPEFELEAPAPQEPDTIPPRFPVSKTTTEEYEDLLKKSPADLKDPENIKTTIEYDIKTGAYIVRTKLGDMELGTPMTLTPEEYQDYSMQQSLQSYFREKNAEEFEKKVNKKFNITDMQFDLGPAERIFGKGGVRVKTQGSAQLSIGLKTNKTDNPSLPIRSRKQTSFNFDEDVQLNVQASVGSKVNFGMNYNTETSFDFDSKQLKLAYTGEEDEIIKSIEAGNVSMTTSNSLINGGAALFGMKADLQFGKLRVNALLAQQESESKTVNSKGGVQTKPFEITIDSYDENRHFFIAQYFRDRYDQALEKLPRVNSAVTINRVEVWITNKQGNYDQARNIVAFSDLGENKHISNPQFSPQGSSELPNNESNNLYQTIVNNYPDAREISKVTQTLNGVLESGRDYEKIESARLLNESEYTINKQLGYISLNTQLQPDDVLAIAYEYTSSGKVYQVGEFSSDNTNNTTTCLYLKLLKGSNMSPKMPFWDLMMKNVYSLNAYSVQKEKFQLNILYQNDTVGTAVNYISEGAIKDQILLKVMNLDRLNSQEEAYSDGFFDFVDGYTIMADKGKVIFPVVEPFGSHLRKKIGNDAIADKYVFQELYDSTLTYARQIAEKNKFILQGEYKASSGAEIQLEATNVARGSVKVTAGGAVLTENVDYTVDYASGIVTILNENIISSGTPVSVSLENQSTYNMQRKTMMGVDLNYQFTPDFSLGATLMHMSEMPLTTKTVMGDESVKNTLWGLNASYKGESQWLTNMLDKLPLLTLTKPSQIAFNAEFAQLIAGHYENDYTGQYSYLDDFESTQSTIDLLNPYPWNLASTPYDDAATALFPEASRINDVEYGKNRALMAWYYVDGIFTRKNSRSLPSHITKDDLSNHYVRAVQTTELFPNRDVSINEDNQLSVLNVAYYPNERGPYNLDAQGVNSDGTLTNPEKRWGGIMRKIDQVDFETANIEYIEFWLMDPFIYNANTAQGGDLYFNLGDISEDILKDEKKFFENGLPVDGDMSQVDTTVWGKVPKQQSTVYAFDNSAGARSLQDVGLNGLSSEEELNFPTYQQFLSELTPRLSAETLEKMASDPLSVLNNPSGDKFHYFRGSDYDAQQLDILSRYKRYNGTEGNSEESTEAYNTASRTTPDVEDLNQDNTLNTNEKYFEYKISLRPKDLQIGSNYIVNIQPVTVTLANGTSESINWYQFKIPVKKYQRKVGSIEDFKTIRFMRMYMTNFKESTILRFGAFDLVRGEWRTYEGDLSNSDVPVADGTLEVSTVNIEENSKKTPVNYVLPPGVSRMRDPSQPQIRQENEQSLSLKVTNLASQDALAVYKSTSYDLRQYKRMQLFSHAEAFINDATALADGELSVFLRLGSDYKNNYYEYEVPLKLTPAGTYSDGSETVWPSQNLLDIQLETLTNLKLNRNRAKRQGQTGVTYQTVYSEYDPNNTRNKISIVGNPSLAEVKVIMIGVRNNSRETKSAEVWVNELRLTDFNEEGGWAANASLNVGLSDLGTVNFAGRIETAGFGALDQSVNERRLDDYSQYSVSTSLELGKFFPEKAKVSIPFYYAYSKETTTPKYDPLNQDIKMKDALDNVETQAEKDSIKNYSIDRTTIKSVSFNNVKVDIQSKNPMPYDPANFSLSYSYSENSKQNPETEYERTKDWNGSFAYNYTPYAKPFRPFQKMKQNNGYTKYLKQFSLNYLPSNISFQTTLMRNYYELQLRDLTSQQYTGGKNNIPVSFSQEFYWDRAFSLRWDFTNNLSVNFTSGTNARIEEPYVQVNKQLNPDGYKVWKDSVMQSIKDLGTPLKYDQQFTVTWNLPLQYIPVLDWVNSSVSYDATYNWERSAEIEGDDPIGNVVKNQRQINGQMNLNLQSLYNKNKYLKKINQKFNTSSRNNNQKKKVKKEVKLEKDIVLNPDSGTIVQHGMFTKKLRITARGADGKVYAVKFKPINYAQVMILNKDTAHLKLTIKPGPSGGEEMWNKSVEYATRFAMMLRRINIQYTTSDGMMLPGFLPEVGDMFGQSRSSIGMAPGLGFAFGGVSRSYIDYANDRGWLITNDSTNITPAMISNARNLNINATLEPIPGLKIDLNANRVDTRNTEVQFMYAGMPETYSGNFTMTTIAIGGSLGGGGNADNNYASKKFDNFLAYREIIASRMENAYARTSYPNSGFIEGTALANRPYNPDNGNVSLNSADVLIPAFLAAYTGKDPSKVELSAFPSIRSLLPNWRITYNGLTKIPFLQRYFKDVTLSHQYKASYSVGSFSSFLNWVDAGQDGLGYVRSVLTGNPTPSSPYDISAVSITDGFSPLLGVDATALNNITGKVEYRTTRNLNLNISSYQLVESNSNEFVIGLGYKFVEFNKVLKMKKTQNFSNDLTVNLDFSYRKTQSLIRKIEEQFTQATSGNIAKTIQFSADYGLSRALTLRAFYDLQINKPLVSSESYPTSNSNYGISLRFSLAQ
jgi:cell surface protein SprA